MNIGLVLSGGGSRGVAHIGVIKALEEHQIVPTHITGSSAGAIVGALYAYGYNSEDIFKFFKDIQILNIKKYALGKPGFIDAEKFYDEFKSYLKEDNFNVLQKSLTITTTDILNGTLKTFSSGELIKPLLASAAVPGVFSPVQMEDSYYVDGGVLNNFPIEFLQKHFDTLIGSYANWMDNISIKDLKHSYQVIERAFKIQSVKKDYTKFKYCDLIIAPKALSKFGTFDKKHLDEIFNIGYNTTKEALTNNPLHKLKPFFRVTS